MKQKLLCGILAAILLLSAVACTGGSGNTETDPNADTAVTDSATDGATEAPTDEIPTEEPSAEDIEPETEPPIEITVPAYTDIGLTDKLTGTDQRTSLDYQFDGMAESLSAIR